MARRRASKAREPFPDLELIIRAVKEAIQEAGTGWPRWMPSKMASRYSGLSEKTPRRLARDGEIYATSVNGGKLLFDKESIDSFMLREKAVLQRHLDRIKKSVL